MNIRQHWLFIFLILNFALVSLVWSGPPDSDRDEHREKDTFEFNIDIDEDSLNRELDKLTLRAESLSLRFDSLRSLNLEDLENLSNLPSFPEILIDENGVIKVLTDTGFVVIKIDSLALDTNFYIYDGNEIRDKPIIRGGRDIIIDEGDRLHSDIILFSGDVIVNGTVEGDVVTIGGDIYVNSTGYIRGDASAIGGRVKKEDGAKIRGASVSIALPFLILPRGSWMQIFAGILLLIMIISLFFSALSISLFPGPIKRITTQLREHPIKSFFFGYFFYIGAFLVWLLLLVSVIGIPLAVLAQPIVMVILTIFAYSAINVLFGEKFFKSQTPIKSFFLGCLITTLIPFTLLVLGYISNMLVIFIFNAILLGLLLFVLLPLGLGAAMLARFGLSRRHRRHDDDNGEIRATATITVE